MIGLVFLGFLFLGFVACAICGNLSRIADAVEAQNQHYGIGVDAPDAPKKEAA